MKDGGDHREHEACMTTTNTKTKTRNGARIKLIMPVMTLKVSARTMTRHRIIDDEESVTKSRNTKNMVENQNHDPGNDVMTRKTYPLFQNQNERDL
jgi:hypothetical protein